MVEKTLMAMLTAYVHVVQWSNTAPQAFPSASKDTATD